MKNRSIWMPLSGVAVAAALMLGGNIAYATSGPPSDLKHDLQVAETAASSDSTSGQLQQDVTQSEQSGVQEGDGQNGDVQSQEQSSVPGATGDEQNSQSGDQQSGQQSPGQSGSQGEQSPGQQSQNGNSESPNPSTTP